MPDFTVKGNPSSVRSRATTMAEKGQLFYETGDGLSKIDTSGWIGRAADAFREAHDLEPDRWYKAGSGFQKAAAALQTYAGELENAQSVAEWAEGEHARGDAETERAQGLYGSYLDRMRSYWASGGTDLAEPFVDSGEAIRQNAIAELDAAKARLDNAAHLCAGQVREGCADAPEEPEWWESGLRFVGGIFEGAGEAVWDLLTMVPFSPVNLVIDSYKLATGDLTPEELVKKYELAGESAVDMAEGIYTGLTTDPVGFGKNLGKSLLDWDTWADDPARAIGHLVPDAVVAAATAGTGALATRGARGGMDALDGLADLNRMGELADLGKLDDLDGIGDLGKVDDLDGLDDLDRLGDAGSFTQADARAIDDYTGNIYYQDLNAHLRGLPTPGEYSAAQLDLLAGEVSGALDKLPAHDGVTLRGTDLPDSLLNDIRPGGTYSDPAFSSSSTSETTAQGFRGNGNTMFHIDGHSGRDVQQYSHYGSGEAEILFDRGTEFQVVRKEWNPDGYWDIWLEE